MFHFSLIVLIVVTFLPINSFSSENIFVGLGKYKYHPITSDYYQYSTNKIINYVSFGKNISSILTIRICYRDYGDTDLLMRPQAISVLDPVTGLESLEIVHKTSRRTLSYLNADLNFRKKIGILEPYFGMGYGVVFAREEYSYFTEPVSQSGVDSNKENLYKFSVGINVIPVQSLGIEVGYSYSWAWDEVLEFGSGFREFGLSVNVIF